VRNTLQHWGVDADQAEEGLAAGGLDNFKVEISGSDPVKTIQDFIHQHCFDLIVLATHQRQGFDRWLHRNLAERIARRSGEMTLFVPRDGEGFVSRETGELKLRNIMVPVNLYPHPQAAIDAAVALADALDAPALELTTVHVCDDDTDETPRFEAPEDAGWLCQHMTRTGDPVQGILEAAKELEPDLIVMTTAGHQGFLDMIRGDSTERVLRESPCPLLAVQAFDAKPDAVFD